MVPLLYVNNYYYCYFIKKVITCHMEKISFICLLSNIRKIRIWQYYFASKKKPFVFCSN